MALEEYKFNYNYTTVAVVPKVTWAYRQLFL